MTISGFVAYVKQVWKNKPDTSSPLSAERLNTIEGGIKGNSDAIEAIAAAVVNQIVNDPNKIASMAALYSVNSQVTQLNSDLTGHKTVFTQDPAEFLPSAGNGFSHCSVLISGTGGNFTNAPPTRTSSVGSAWWNVLTFGSTTRCTQVAFYAFTVYAGGGLIYFRRQHDGTVSNWIQVG